MSEMQSRFFGGGNIPRSTLLQLPGSRFARRQNSRSDSPFRSRISLTNRPKSDIVVKSDHTSSVNVKLEHGQCGCDCIILFWWTVRTNTLSPISWD